jgi:hypothetical protein
MPMLLTDRGYREQFLKQVHTDDLIRFFQGAPRRNCLSIALALICCNIDNMLKNRPSFSITPPECPMKEQCAAILSNARQKQGEFIWEHPDVVGDIEQTVHSRAGSIVERCYAKNGSSCAIDPIVKKEWQWADPEKPSAA